MDHIEGKENWYRDMTFYSYLFEDRSYNHTINISVALLQDLGKLLWSSYLDFVY